jgi:glycosyltransferase involved in cell wall biosynthesis
VARKVALTDTALPSARPVLCYVVTEDWFFLSHRLPMALAARDAGFVVHVLARDGGSAEAIRKHGFAFHPVDWKRGFHPTSVVKVLVQLRVLMRRIKPALIHFVALQPSLIGAFSITGLGIPHVNGLTGMGSVFLSDSAKGRLLRSLIRRGLSWVVTRPEAVTLVQNQDDRSEVLALQANPNQIVLIPGSGVDTDKLSPTPEPPQPISIGFVGRLLKDKGLPELIEAHRMLVSGGLTITLRIAGDTDPANPSSIAPETIEQWRQRPGVIFVGVVKDIQGFWQSNHIAVLPSRREGLPKSLLEAAACGRSIVATDVPGCREVARPGINGILVPLDDVRALADALRRLAQDPDMRRRYGAASRELAVSTFSSAIIGQSTVQLYRRLLSIAHL